MKLELLPAVDVAGGQAVRLTQGETGTEESLALLFKQLTTGLMLELNGFIWWIWMQPLAEETTGKSSRKLFVKAEA